LSYISKDMHKEILSEKQVEFLPQLQIFAQNFGLIGGTAIALYLGHRQSIDFDLACVNREIDVPNIRKKILEFGKIDATLVDSANEYTIVVDGIKFTFLNYPFLLEISERMEDIIALPDIATLAAMKAYALGRRAKWKDYVDLYFIIQKFGSLAPIIEKSKRIFETEFNEKNFRAQLAYFEDIDYSEEVIFSAGFEVGDAEIKQKLLEYALN